MIEQCAACRDWEDKGGYVYSCEVCKPIPAPQKDEGYFTPAYSVAAFNDEMRKHLEYAAKAIREVTGLDDVSLYGLPQSSGIPATARAILNIVPEKKTPQLTDKQKQQAESIGRAVANMSRPHDVYMPCSKDWGA